MSIVVEQVWGRAATNENRKRKNIALLTNCGSVRKASEAPLKAVESLEIADLKRSQAAVAGRQAGRQQTDRQGKTKQGRTRQDRQDSEGQDRSFDHMRVHNNMHVHSNS